MKIATWNVNSINARIEHLVKFIKKDQSDIYLIQELKCIEDAFPYEKIEKLGYYCYVTPDNPRTEKLTEITADIVSGFRANEYAIFDERGAGLRQALDRANSYRR